MNTGEDLKKIVRDKYASIALHEPALNAASCCGCGPVSTQVYNIMTDKYDGIKGYREEADLGLGCGLPTQFAKIKAGDVVVDLGSGAGNDCFVARHETGSEGKVIGVDFTPEMIRKARQNAEKLGFNNVEFREGDLEAIPISQSIADVVVSNCVLNLVPNKTAVWSEIFRILKPGGHFSISDIVLTGALPDALREQAELYAGCVSGAIQETEYMELIEKTGFVGVVVQKKKPIIIPDDILRQYLSDEQRKAFITEKTGIFSITVYGEKPV